MNTQEDPNKPVIENPWTESRVPDELTRVKIFLGIQAFFLLVSIFTGGFNFELWSMLDTALMIQSIGVTALVVVLEEARHRRLAFQSSPPPRQPGWALAMYTTGTTAVRSVPKVSFCVSE